MKIKRIYYLISFILLLLCSPFWSCEKLTNDEKQDIERFKNSHRDSQIIGQWKYKGNSSTGEFITVYKNEGVVEQARAVYDENGDVIKYKKEKMEVFFYTENNDTRHLYIVNRGILGTSYEDSAKYRIEKDTLYIYNFYSGSLINKGIRVNVKIEN